MISDSEYELARAQHEASENVMNQYHAQKKQAFMDRWERFTRGDAPFIDPELCYSANSRCQCGAGLACPKEAHSWHWWDCSSYLKGEGPKHDSYGFAFYEIKSEDQPSAKGATTRPLSVTV